VSTTSTRVDPFRSFNFELKIDNTTAASFSECSGLTVEGDAVDYRNGDDAVNNVRKLVGLRKFTNVVLKRGQTTEMSLVNWYVNIANGVPDRRNVTITLMNEARVPVIYYHLENAWLNKLDLPSFKAAGNEVAIESAELVHEGVTVEVAPASS
jgi:phage tail-like protein